MKSLFRRRSREGERGQALVEFALVSLIFFVFLFSIFDLARLLQSWITVQHAAREGARYAVTGRLDCAGTGSRDACIIWTAENATHALSGGGPAGPNVDVSFKAWDYNTYSAAVDNKTGKPCDQVEVTVTYRHHFVVPVLQLLAPDGVTISGSQRMTNEPFGQCKNADGVG